MNVNTARMLRAKAEEVARMFSKTDRGGNFNAETFHVDRIVPLSECTAAVMYRKDPTNKRAVAWFYFINSRAKPRWEYFFVTYSHLVGLQRVADLLHNIEQHNFELSMAELEETPVRLVE